MKSPFALTLPFCPKCGREVLASDKFCLNCGQPLDSVLEIMSGPVGPSQQAPQIPMPLPTDEEATPMNFCPSCGTALEPNQNFCRRCGRNIKAGSQIPSSPPGFLGKPVLAMNTENIYSFGDDVVAKISTAFPLVAVPVIMGAALGVVAAVFLASVSWTALTTAFTLVLLPIFGGLRARRLRSLVQLPRQQLLAHKGVKSIPWSAIEYMAIKGRTLTFKQGNRWTSTTIDKADSPRLGAKASSTPGIVFVPAPENPSHSARNFAILAIVLFAATQALTIGASIVPFFPGEQERYTSLYNTVRSGLGPTISEQWGEIFLNNIQIAFESFVPGFGLFTLTAASYNTGRIIQAAAIHFSVSPTYFLYALYILPHSIVEEFSYPLAGALGLYAFTWRKQSYSEFANWRTRASTKVSGGFAIVAMTLGIAAFLEVTEPHLGIGALLYWVPVVLGGGYIYFRYRARIASALA